MISSSPHIQSMMESQVGTIISIVLGKKELMYIRHQILMCTLGVVGQENFYLIFVHLFSKFLTMWAH